MLNFARIVGALVKVWNLTSNHTSAQNLRMMENVLKKFKGNVKLLWKLKHKWVSELLKICWNN